MSQSTPPQSSLTKMIGLDLFGVGRLHAILLIFIFISAIGAVLATHNTRQMAVQRENLLLEKDILDGEWRNLILEQRALSEHSRVEDIARRQLLLVHTGDVQLLDLGAVGEVEAHITLAARQFVIGDQLLDLRVDRLARCLSIARLVQLTVTFSLVCLCQACGLAGFLCRVVPATTRHIGLLAFVLGQTLGLGRIREACL